MSARGFESLRLRYYSLILITKKYTLLPNIIVLGDFYGDISYESHFYEGNAILLTSKISNFIRYTPDDLNKNILEKIVFKGLK